MRNENEGGDIYSPRRLLFIIVATTFVVETVLMYVLSILPPAPAWVQILVDASMLVVLSFPVVYFFSFRPMVQHSARRARAEAALKQINDELETTIQERTADLAAANAELESEIAERMRFDAALRESEFRYRSLFNNMTEGFALHEVILDATGQPRDSRFLEVNYAFERQTGLKHDHIVGRLRSEVIPDADPAWIREVGAVALTGLPRRFEHSSPALQRHYAVFAYRPAPGQFAAVTMDVTERKLAEQETQRYLNGLELLSGAGMRLLEMNSEEEILSYVGRQVQSLLSDGLVIVSAFEPSANCVVVHAVLGSPDDMARLETLVGRSPIGLTFPVPDEYRKIMRGGELQPVAEGVFGLAFRHMPREVSERIEAELELGTAYAMPFAARGDLLGLIAIITQRGQPIPAAPIIEAFIGMAAVAIQRRRAEDALRDSEARLSKAQEIAHLGSWELDLARNRLTWSDEVYRIFGLQPQAFAATYEAFLERVHPDDRAAVDAAYTASRREGRAGYAIEHRVIRPEAPDSTGSQPRVETRWVFEKCQHSFDATGKIVRSVGMVLDITERRRAEMALRQAHDELELRVQARTAELLDVNLKLHAENAERRLAEQYLEHERARLKGILDAMPDGIYIVSQQRGIEYTNPALERDFGIANGCRCFEYLHGRTEPCPWCVLDAMSSGQMLRSEQHSSRTGKTYDIYDVPIRNPDGAISKLKIMHDITARKRAEDEIRQRNRELAALNEISREITSKPDLDRVLAELLDHVREVVGATMCAVGLIEAQSGDVMYYQPVTNDGQAGLSAGKRLREGEGIAGRVIAERRSACIRDASVESTCRLDLLVSDASAIRSVACVPLIAHNDVIGVMTLLDEQPGAFDENQMRLLESVAAQAAVTIANARLYNAEQRARQTAEILRSASTALTETLDMNQVTETLLDYVRQLVPYDSACVILLEGESRLSVRANRGYERWTDPAQILTLALNANTNPIVRAMFKDQSSKIVADTQKEPGWEFLPGAEHIQSWLGVPVTVEGKVIGLCSLDKAERNFFTPDHLRLAGALVGQAAVAIQNAWLFEQVRAGRARLAALSHRLVQVQDAERAYISRELHDEAGQLLTTLLVGLRLLKEEAEESEESEALVAGVDELSHMVEEVLAGLHRLAVDLRPASLDHLGLLPALRQHIEALTRTHKLDIQFDAIGIGIDTQRLPADLETTLYRFVQEALTNVIRHARATRAKVRVERRGSRVIASVEDDGVGFDSTVQSAQGERLGLFGMRERADMLGGSLFVKSAPGAGTTVTMEVSSDDAHPDCR